jgi:hypothetical protein
VLDLSTIVFIQIEVIITVIKRLRKAAIHCILYDKTLTTDFDISLQILDPSDGPDILEAVKLLRNFLKTTALVTWCLK